jgi:NADPH-dependent 2,4-dienoyl-CoA reductase/sulfur reductase-like enzyme
MNYVIIGTGPAGVVAAETLRQRQPIASITLIGDEPELPYSRMAIPYHLIGDIAEDGTHLRKSPAHFEREKIQRIEQHVTNIQADAHQLSLANGEQLSFDKLLIATGSRAVRPPIAGMDLPGVTNCWTLADARRIIAKANRGDDVILMGAGFIGCIILEALAKRGVNLTVVEMENRMVPRMMDEQSGGLLKRWCEQQGVRVLTSTRVKSVGAEGDKLGVELEGQAAMKVDLLICATGVKPNTELAKGWLQTEHGILVNRRLQTSHADIFAAGDVAEGRDFSTGDYSVQAIQPTAVEHGFIAATNMSGGDYLHRGSINMNVLDTMGLISSSFGLWQGVEDGESATLNDPEHYRYINLQFKGDRLVGANTLGMTQHIGALRGLIQNKTHLGKWKANLMDNPSRFMEAYLQHRVA